MADTIQRIIVTFVDIIYSSNRKWTEGEILQRLHGKGYYISQSTLNRDLNRYHEFFNVERLDKCSEHHTPVYQRSNRTVTEAVMSEAEIELLTMLSLLKEQFWHLLSAEAQALLDEKLAKIPLQRVRLFKNVREHKFLKLEDNLRLILKYEAAGSIQDDYLKALSIGLSNSKPLEIYSSVLPADTFDIFTPTHVYEQDGDLWVTGMSELQGGTNEIYCVSKFTSVRCADSIEQAPTKRCRA